MGGWKWAASLSHSPLARDWVRHFKGSLSTLALLRSMLVASLPWGWAPEPQGLGYMGIWAPLQGPLCHFLATFKHTEVVRWSRS